MAEGVDRGGLNYEINVTGNFEEKFAKFQTLLKKLESQPARTTETQDSVTKGADAAKAETNAVRQTTIALNKKSAVERKILSLMDRQKVAGSKQVTQVKVITDKVEQRQKADVANLKVQQKSTKESIAQSKAEERIAKASLKVLEVQRAIAIARKSGISTVAGISKETGLSPTQLGNADKELAKQNQSLREQTRLNKKIRADQEKQKKNLANNARIHRQIRDLARQRKITEADAAKQLGVTALKARELGIEMKKTLGFADRFLFTFRRLVGILAIFTLARKFSQVIAGGVREMSRFNSVLEQSKISLGSLISSASIMVDVNGDLVEGTEKYVSSLQEAEKLQNAIRVDALGTVATFEELLGAVQAGIGPGLAAGLDLDQIRTVSISLAKAASTLGVAGAGFAEEIRSILLGVGSLRQTKLLQVLGLSRENIREAKEQGRVFEQITEAVEAFNIATQDVQKSFEGLQSQIKDSTSTLLASGSVEYFETLKSAAQAFLDSLIQVEEVTGLGIGIDDDAVGAVEEISSALGDIVKTFGQLTTFEEIFANVRADLALVGESLRVIVSATAPIVVGFLQGATAVAAMLAAIIKITRVIVGIVPTSIVKSFKEVLKFVSAIVGGITAWIILTKIFNGILLISKTIIGSIAVIQAVVETLYLTWLILLDAVQGKMTIIAALQAIITAGVSLVTVAVAAIVVLLGVILVKTGLISKLFDKLNKSLGITTDKLEDIKDGILGNTNALFGQSNAVTKLEESFANVELQIKKTQNAIKATILTGAIRGEAKKLFDVVGKGAEDLANRLIDLDDEIELNRQQIEAQEKKRDADRLKRIETEGKSLKELDAIFSRTRDLRQPSAFRIALGRRPEPGEASPDVVRERQEEQAANDKILVVLKAKQKQLDDARAEVIAQQTKLIKEQIALAQVQLDQQNLNTDLITKAFDLRKALAQEELRKSGDSLLALKLQSIELEKQQALLIKNEEIRKADLDARDATIAKARELGQSEDDIRILEEARLQVAGKNALIRSREESIIRRMKADLNDMADIVINNDWLEALSSGLQSAVQDFVQSADPMGVAFAESFSAAIGDAISSTSDAITDFIDPRTEDPDVATVAGEVLLGLANDLINNILTQFTADLLSQFFLTQTQDQINNLVTEANTLAIGALTTAIGGDIAATAVDTAATTGNTVATTANTGGLFANLGALFANTTATIFNTIKGVAAFIANTIASVANTIALWVNTAVPGTKGGLVTPRGGLARGFANGGMIPQYHPVQGLARGGDVRSHPRPSHISPMDTVPAWLQPGEFVIPKMRVKQFGPAFFEQIRLGTITPDMGQRFLASQINRTSGVYGMAHGGIVGGSGASRSRAGTSGGQGGRTIVLPILPADENTMEQIIAGGRDVFEDEVNNTDDIGNPNESNNN